MRPVFALVYLALCVTALAQTPIAEKTKGMQRVEGLFVTYRDSKANKLMMEIAPSQLREFLFVTAIRTGLGSNDVGLDRGSLGPSEVVKIKRVADKVMFEVPNLAFRATTNDPNEQRAVRESFAPSMLWAGKVEAENEDGTVLIDVSSLVLSDANDVAGTLRQTGQGTASIDASRSAIDFEQLKSFPKNVEFEAVLTFRVTTPGNFVRATVPIPESWTIVQHMSLIELPDDKYQRREFDPRVGAFGISYSDYGAPLDASIYKRFASRHRLERQPGTRKPVEPIIYYVDNGAPEPIKSALIEGASWWNEAFEAAGFEDAFQVRELPADADPLDARYNVIQWVHRSTRGWSYGASITDPRTGEIIKGHVTLGSLRVRQDRLIFEGLLGTAKTGTGADDDPVQLALKRIRQLSAHEVGHTLGLAHNFAASVNGRGSVMDYPAPRVTARNGRIDVSDTYGVGIGEYDKHAVKWLYSVFERDEKQQLERIVADARRQGILFLSDGDARSLSAADPRASLWDDGEDPVEALREAMEVRRIALRNFGTDRLPKDEPMAFLQEVFVPIFLYHRYQVEAAVKAIGGVRYVHSTNTGNAPKPTAVSAEDQRAALKALIDCLALEFVTVPSHIVPLMAPRTFGIGGSREIFGSRTSPTFDPITASEAAADIVLSALLDPARLERVAQQRDQDEESPGLTELLSSTTEAIIGKPTYGKGDGVAWGVRTLYVSRLMQIDNDATNTIRVRGAVNAELVKIKDRLGATDPTQRALAAEIDRYLARPAGAVYSFPRPTAVPPGSPIGWGGDCSLGY